MAWEVVLGVPGARFVTLQYRPIPAARATLAARGVMFDPAIAPLVDMDGFAAQVAAMNLAISIDNSTAQLAGALGKSICTLSSKVAEWRWQLERTDTPWYPSMHLSRQARLMEWTRFMSRVADEHGALVAPGAGP